MSNLLFFLSLILELFVFLVEFKGKLLEVRFVVAVIATGVFFADLDYWLCSVEDVD